MNAILTYHSIDESGSAISINRAQFEVHRRFFSSGRVRILPLDALLRDQGDGDAVAITFDDGFLNTRDALHALAADRIPFTVFVVSGHVGSTNAWGGRDCPGIPTMPLLGWNDLEQLAARGAAIEPHSRAHRFLTTLSDSEIDDELGGGQAELRSRLGVAGRTVAYPYGDLDERVVGRARQFYEFGCTTDFRLLGPTADPLLLPRLDMFYYRASLQLDRTWGTPGFYRRVQWIRAKRGIRALLHANGT